MKTSRHGIELIKEHEAFRAEMYHDAAGLPTIGYGTLIDSSGEQWLLAATISEAQASELLARDLVQFERTIDQSVSTNLTQNQFDALASLVYNIGPGNFKGSQVLKKINAKAGIVPISKEWVEWNKANGQTLGGLTMRRIKEIDLFFDHVKKKPYCLWQ